MLQKDSSQRSLLDMNRIKELLELTEIMNLFPTAK
jgi:hypothetical protein